MAIRESYQIGATNVNDLVTSLNRILGRISDRLDKIEGLRDELETASGTFSGDVSSTSKLTRVDPDGNILHSME